MLLALAFLLGLAPADLMRSRFISSLTPAATEPRIIAAGGGTRYTVHTVIDIISLENPGLLMSGRLIRVGPDDTVLWELVLRTQTLTGVAPGPQNTVFVAGYGVDRGFVSRYDAGGKLVWTKRIEGQPAAIASDVTGNVYATGAPNENYAATEGAFKSSRGEAKCSTRAGTAFVCSDAFVTKVSADGQVVYATFLGGTMEETATDIAVDSDGSVYVVGETMSSDFPTTPLATQPKFGGVVTPGPLKFGDGFVARLDRSGSRLIYGTYLGGPLADRLNAVAVDSSGIALVTGRTEDDPNIMPGVKGDAVLDRLDPNGRGLGFRQVRTDGTDYGVDAAIGLDGRNFVSILNEGVHELDRETLNSIRVAPVRAHGPVAIAAEASGVVNMFTRGEQRTTKVFAVSPGDNYYGSDISPGTTSTRTRGHM